ncbi:hypothetical protein [Alteribacillus sp. HJP-4]|uniref:hypothetical protein n=1 Tax=Alteribacillus sp. HJP-4 TaxID=2775394 RepID=UPI0035CCEE6F
MNVYEGAHVLGMTILVILITLLQWILMKQNEKKEKAASVSILTIGWALAFIYIVFPESISIREIVTNSLRPVIKVLGLI